MTGAIASGEGGAALLSIQAPAPSSAVSGARDLTRLCRRGLVPREHRRVARWRSVEAEGYAAEGVSAYGQ